MMIVLYWIEILICFKTVNGKRGFATLGKRGFATTHVDVNFIKNKYIYEFQNRKR